MRNGRFIDVVLFESKPQENKERTLKYYVRVFGHMFIVERWQLCTFRCVHPFFNVKILSNALRNNKQIKTYVFMDETVFSPSPAINTYETKCINLTTINSSAYNKLFNAYIMYYFAHMRC